MAPKNRTAFDKYVNTRMKDRAFADQYEDARAEIEQIDKLVRFLDDARQTVCVTGLKNPVLLDSVGVRIPPPSLLIFKRERELPAS